MTLAMPRWLAPFAVAAAALIAIPVVAVIVRVDWSSFGSLVTSRASTDALGLSLRTSAVATVACVVLGVPLGYALATMRWRGTAALRAVVLAPLVMPPVVGGLALLYAFGRRGLVGPGFEALGVHIAFTSVAVIIAQTFVSLPFMVLAIETALRSRDGRHEAIAATLGAHPTTILRRVTLPAIGPAVATGTVLAFARALGEFGATLAFAGSLQGVTRTAPLEIYLARESDPEAAIAIALVLLVVAVAVVAIAFRPVSRAWRS